MDSTAVNAEGAADGKREARETVIKQGSLLHTVGA
jgi:hypothetical protein